jgi:two-component system, NarL family, sensor histidine kinase DesK
MVNESQNQKMIPAREAGPATVGQRMNLRPGSKGAGWGPYVWLAYLVFFFIQPVMDHAGRKEWALTLLGVGIFLCLYIGLFRVTQHNRTRALLHIAGIVLLGVVYAPSILGSSTFFIFACAFAPFVVDTELLAVLIMAAIVAIAGLETWLLHLPFWFAFYGCGLAAIIGGGNIFFAQRNRSLAKLRMAHEEIEHLAKVAERERIARDLHDVLGHTLSVVILKSELAGKLMERDPERAGKEIREVEQIARQALTDVREAIRGYRARGLTAELAMAKSTLETAGITVQCDVPAAIEIPPLQEGVLSLAVREAVTNVVRHSQARSCRLQLEQRDGSCRLEVGDDGRGGSSLEGNGLRGMRERVEMLGGTLNRTTTAGTTLTITLPLNLKETPECPQ